MRCWPRPMGSTYPTSPLSLRQVTATLVEQTSLGGGVWNRTRMYVQRSLGGQTPNVPGAQNRGWPTNPLFLNTYAAPPVLRNARRLPHLLPRPPRLPPPILRPVILLSGLLCLWSFSQRLGSRRGRALLRRLARSSGAHPQVGDHVRIVRTAHAIRSLSH